MQEPGADAPAADAPTANTPTDYSPATDSNDSVNTVRSHRVRFAGALTTRVIEDIGMNYSKTVGCAILIGISHVLIGAIAMTTCFYSLHTGEFHGALFNMAFNFLAAEAILSLSFINGWSTPLRRKHRRYAHALLQICGIPFVAFGALSISGPYIDIQTRTMHGLTGVITLVLAAVCWVLGPIALNDVRPAVFTHMIVGIVCFVMSTLCLCLGLMKDKFKKWAGHPLADILVGCVIFYSFFIVYTTCMKCIQRYKIILAPYRK